LDIDIDAKKSVGAIFTPSISINNHTFRGDYLDTNELFKAICSTMYNRPPICSTVNLAEELEDIVKYLTNGVNETLMY
jgi:hypothetical protein